MKQPNKQHRVFVNTPIDIEKEINCSNETAHHIQNVLRIKKNEKVIVFNGNGKEFQGHLMKGNQVKIQITKMKKNQ